MAKMSIMEKIYFISAWVVSGCAVLTLILTAIAYRHNGLQAMGAVLDWIAIGIAGCFTLLHFSSWFRNGIVEFIMGWVVGGLYLLSMILTAAANLGGVGTVAVLFGHIGLGAFLTLLLLHLSGMLNIKSKAETTDTKTAGK
jgi:hypothetical protein